MNLRWFPFLLYITLTSFRSEYFKTALNTTVGGPKKSSVKVEECSLRVLSAIISFMYGRNLGEEVSLDWEEATRLVAMADLYCMDDLKDAAALNIKPLLHLENVLETAELAVKYNCEKLKEVACDFALSKIPPDDRTNDLLQKLLLISPMLGLRALESTHVASKALGVDLLLSPFKKRKDFSSQASYADYVRQQLKPNMLVMCNEESHWGSSYWGPLVVPVGCVGRVVSFDSGTALPPLIKWDSNTYNGPRLPEGRAEYLDILTLPINLELLVDKSTS